MGRKRKKIKEKEGFKPETAKDPIDADSPEVIEAVEQFNTAQSEAIADLMDDAPDGDLPNSDRVAAPDEDTPEEITPDETEAMSQERESQPEAKEQAEESEAKAEEQPPAESTEGAKADVPESDEQPKEQPEKSVQSTESSKYLSGESFNGYTVEVITEDGARAVPLSNLVTTYQKYPETQKKYAELKPVRDLAKIARVEISQVLPLLELGIQTYAKQAGIMSGSQPPVAGTGQSMPMQQPGQMGYQGPFKDAETDEYYKESDPELYQSMHNNFRMAMEAASRIQNLELQMQRSKAEPPAPSGPSEDEVMKAFDDKILSWSGNNDYFTVPNIGEVRLTGFKNFIMKNHAGKMKLSELTPDFLSSEFVRFDPKYNLEFAKQLNEKKAKSAQNDSGMFAEGSDVRSKAVPLDEQQNHMADMF